MTRNTRYEYFPTERVLSLDPMRQGFGYAVVEDEFIELIDWGVSLCRRSNHGSCGNAFRKLVDRYRPTAVVFEDGRDATASRSEALVGFRGRIAAELMTLSVPVYTYPMAMVRGFFADGGAYTKQQIADLLAVRFPELAPRLPKPRQVWESEDTRMAIFDAVALALVDLNERVGVSGQGLR